MSTDTGREKDHGHTYASASRDPTCCQATTSSMSARHEERLADAFGDDGANKTGHYPVERDKAISDLSNIIAKDGWDEQNTLFQFISELEANFPFIHHQGKMSTSDEQVLPNKLPLKRRLAEYRHSHLHGPTITNATSASAPPTHPSAISGTNLAMSFTAANSSMASAKRGPSFSTTVNTASTTPTTIAAPITITPPISATPITTNTTTTNATTTTTNAATAPSFTTNLWAIEKFRDITPAFVLAVFEDSLVFEPGDIGPLSIDNPLSRDLIWCINNQALSPSMMDVLREFGAPFYDGSVVVGIVDYRKHAFGIMTGSSGAATGSSTATNIGASAVHANSSSLNASAAAKVGIGASQARPTIAPEMHKILLKPTYASLLSEVDYICDNIVIPNIAGGSTGGTKQNSSVNSLSSGETQGKLNLLLQSDWIRLEVESRLLLATSGPLCLDPSPIVGRTMMALDWDRRKFAATLNKSILEPPSMMSASACLKPSHGHGISSTTAYGSSVAFKERVYPLLSRREYLFYEGVIPKCRMLSMIENFRIRREESETEPMYGLDIKKDPTKVKFSVNTISPSQLFAWIQPHQRLWRTIRYELDLDGNEVLKNISTKSSATSSIQSSEQLAFKSGNQNPIEQNNNSTQAANQPISTTHPPTANPQQANSPSTQSQPFSSPNVSASSNVGSIMLNSNLNWTKQKIHYTFHILCTVNGQFDVIIRIGLLPFAGETRRIRFATKPLIDQYIEQIRHMMAIEGCTCVADVSHPSALSQTTSSGSVITANMQSFSSSPAISGQQAKSQHAHQLQHQLQQQIHHNHHSQQQQQPSGLSNSFSTNGPPFIHNHGMTHSNSASGNAFSMKPAMTNNANSSNNNFSSRQQHSTQPSQSSAQRR